jgi:hypothetical protein
MGKPRFFHRFRSRAKARIAWPSAGEPNVQWRKSAKSTLRGNVTNGATCSINEQSALFSNGFVLP